MIRYVTPLLAFLSATSTSADASGQLDGVWQTDGYGWVASIEGGQGQLFSMAGDFCLPDVEETLPLETLLPGISLFPSDNGELLLISLVEFEPDRIRAERLSSLPEACLRDVSDTPMANFEALLAFFDQHYPFFDIYGVDWQTHVAQMRRQVRDDMSEDELFRLMSDLLRPVQDGHVALITTIDGEQRRFFTNRGRTQELIYSTAESAGEDPKLALDKFRDDFWYAGVQENLLGGSSKFAGNDLIQYGMINDTVGYLAFASVGGFGRDRADLPKSLRQTRRYLDQAMRFFDRNGASSLIVDLSLNYGGHDHIAREIASRFATEQDTLVYSKYASDADEPIQTIATISPSERPRFDGPVYLVTSNITISGGEILTLSMRALPQVTHVGERTRGAFSDILPKRLPNGWTLHLSNEVYLDAEGQHWEARGIQPDIEMPIFSDADPIASHTQAILGLVETIDQSTD